MTQIEPLAPDDVRDAVDLLWRLREHRARVAPRFWRQADDVRARHEPFLRLLLDDPGTLALRTPHGFLVAPWRHDHYEVDDIAVPEERWPDEGAALLRAAMERGPIRAVAPRCEPRRHTVVAGLAPDLQQTWWNLDLEPPWPGRLGDLGREDVTAAMVEAPPVYAPGGPVLLLRDAASADAVQAGLEAGARRGAVTAIYAQRPRADLTDETLTDETLTTLGFEALTDFFTSAPASR